MWWIGKFIVGFGIGLFAISTVDAAQDVSPPDPVQIRAKSMTIKNNDNVATFEGSVIVTRGALTMLADRVEVSFSPVGDSTIPNRPSVPGAIGNSNFRDVRFLHAEGHVVVTQEATRAESDEARYDGATEVVTLTGDPVVVEDKNRVAGSKITIYLKENRSVVENSRVLVEPATDGPMKQPTNP